MFSENLNSTKDWMEPKLSIHSIMHHNTGDAFTAKSLQIFQESIELISDLNKNYMGLKNLTSSTAIIDWDFFNLWEPNK
ncbi:hypothetical protein [Pedobacter gandavensis]|uniref:Uncharacterized protein n=1 Tax=Pedobacter gandavensis TaxID=2679963 RepID=A0ABR6EWR0_9SPHI|nr:hypothetical protein [Pedobacter gandavensis]MBB2149720.1 hypothetical protein [Pedobacter gandavensis]